MRFASSVTGLLTAACLFAAAGESKADAAADALFTAGKALLDEGKTAEACEKFEESYRLEPLLGALLNLANCREQEGRLASAWARWGEAVEMAAQSRDARGAFAADRRNALEPRLPKLELRGKGDPSGLTIYRDGAEVRAALLGVPVPIDPGEHQIEVVRDDEVLWREKVRAVEGELSKLELDFARIAASPSLGRRQGAPPKPAPAPSAPMQVESGTSTQAIVGFVVGGAGLLATTAGFVFGGLAMGRKNSASDPSNCTTQGSCAPSGLDAIGRAETLSHLSTGFVIGGAAVTTLGLVLVLTAPSGGPASELDQRASLEPTIRLGLAPQPGGGALILGGSF